MPANHIPTSDEEAIPLPGVPAEAQQNALHEDAAAAFIHLRQEIPGQFELHPAYQRHRYDLSGNFKVEETIFVPHVASPAQARRHPDLEAPFLYQVVSLHNHSKPARRLRIYGYARLRGETPPDIAAVYNPALCQGALVATNVSQPDWVRIFGISGPVHVSGWGTTFDASQIYETTHVFPLDNDTSANGDVLGALQVDVDLEPDERVEFAFITGFSPHGEQSASQIFGQGWGYQRALSETIAYYTDAVGVTEVMTPDPLINQGVTWAKVNMLRVMCDYPTCPAFTNDPSRSSAVVGRDAAWFIYGCDHLLPSRPAHGCSQRRGSLGAITPPGSTTSLHS